MNPVVVDDLDVLARRAAGGDDRAVEALCRALQGDVWRYCRALAGEDELAVEAAQETFVRVVRSIRSFRGEGPARVWVLVIARRAVADLIAAEVRRRSRHSAVEIPDVLVADATGRADVEALVAALPPRLAQAFVLTQVVGLTYEEAARVAGCRIGTVRSRVFRARQQLVAALAVDGQEECRVGA